MNDYVCDADVMDQGMYFPDFRFPFEKTCIVLGCKCKELIELFCSFTINKESTCVDAIHLLLKMN
jgi:hypothetical protein